MLSGPLLSMVVYFLSHTATLGTVTMDTCDAMDVHDNNLLYRKYHSLSRQHLLSLVPVDMHLSLIHI